MQPVSDRPYWLDTVPAVLPREAVPLPESTDVAVIGGGYTGVSAALTLARRGVDVTVLERETLGWGASSRNGGFVLPGFKLGARALLRQFGRQRARSLFAASCVAVDFVERLVAEEGIACDFERCGHVSLAYKPRHIERLAASQRCLRDQFGYETELLDRAALAGEIGSPLYHGGLRDRRAGALNPARYFAGLAAAAGRAGARLCESVDVVRMQRTTNGVTLTTSRGETRAGAVVVATNGYSGAVERELRRRVVPIGSYIVATEPLGESLTRELIPHRRVLSDTKNLLFYFRLSSDERLLFGGRASFTPTDWRESARILTAGMRTVFPQLAAARVDYSWSGNVAFTRDQLPHAGERDGVHYAMGYCGHGVAQATYLGARVAETIAGGGDLTPFSELEFPTIPFYSKNAWFLPLVGAYFRLLDRLS